MTEIFEQVIVTRQLLLKMQTC